LLDRGHSLADRAAAWLAICTPSAAVLPRTGPVFAVFLRHGFMIAPV
jgi:hypothetical protein